MKDIENSSEEIEYEKRLRRRLKILQEQFKAGKVYIQEGLGIENSLLAVRYGTDGEIDLNTVDGAVRSMALAITAIHDREEMKKEISLHEIQKTYFSFIESNFGGFYKEMARNELTPHQVGRALTRNKEFMDGLKGGLRDFLNAITEFWEAVGEVAHIHVEDMRGNVKGVFGGDLFPAQDENIASKCGVFTDTIILPDPFLRSKHIFEHNSYEDCVYYLVKHAMNILKYKELACAELDTPIVAIIPDLSVLQESEKEFYRTLGRQDALIHAGKLFGREFESFDELIEFGYSLDTIERVTAEIRDESRVLFDTNWKGNTESQLKRALESKHYKPFINSPGMLLASQSFSRMSVSNELLIKSRQLNGTPIIDAPTSWQYLVWKMEYDADRAESQLNSQGLHILKGLGELAHNEMQWLGNIPSLALIQLRKEGAMEEIRSILGKGVNEIIQSNPQDFHGTKDKILGNIDFAFKQHKENIKELTKKKWRFAGKDIGSWLVVGSLEVTAAVTGTPAWGLITIAADQMLDVPKLKDIPKSIRSIIEENNKVKKSPVGMLFNIKKTNS
ncbi:hypothetical protein C3369_01385 [Escherichia sp. ESNIH1]|uniref:hypothetical protein n=1 Tax=Escherichia sp. ESNIH1 TaxID=1985876 RepID=UPI000CDD7084|nr:hypothetical protein [Escherichia sp. ESNIH1]POU04044.1 hypothetical protein C3369_01385 [Escherichia sp. ESNIH1]